MTTIIVISYAASIKSVEINPGSGPRNCRILKTLDKLRSEDTALDFVNEMAPGAQPKKKTEGEK